ncbi:MAG: hypothetical protein H0U27_09035 [Nitrosopumilus sp.]|nr:hypothetical protein [Nitrosopumilus sp.]
MSYSYPGLQNGKQRCFGNSIVTALYGFAEFRQLVLMNNAPKVQPLRNLFDKLQAAGENLISTDEFFETIKDEEGRFNGTRQEDANEFLL